MYLRMGDIGSGSSPAYLQLASYGGHTFMESSNNRNIYLRVFAGILTGSWKEWGFISNGYSYNPLNITVWNTTSDRRVKENIKKANLKICYENVKNINLYRYNYIEGFKKSATEDKNQLGFIAQQVKKHFPKAVKRYKHRLENNKEVPDLCSLSVDQLNFTLFGSVKQLIKLVEKQSKRIKKLETLLNIDDDDEVNDDSNEAYFDDNTEEECCIDDIEPTEVDTSKP